MEMAKNGITGWRLQAEVIFPTAVPSRPIQEWYPGVPDGVDITHGAVVDPEIDG
jgi:hypothetical protein